MNEHSIICSDREVRGILDGTHTQMRRVINLRKVLRIPDAVKVSQEDLQNWNIAVHPAAVDGWVFWQSPLKPTGQEKELSLSYDHGVNCPYGKPGDRLWVRETCGIDPNDNGYPEEQRQMFVQYRADWGDEPYHWGWNSPIFMPRWASRIALEVVSVRAERVQDITKADARAEGMHFGFTLGKGEPKYNFNIGAYDAYTANFRRLWDAINARRGYGWNINPWVWVIEFKMIEPEITKPG